MTLRRKSLYQEIKLSLMGIVTDLKPCACCMQLGSSLRLVDVQAKKKKKRKKRERKGSLKR